MKLKKSVTFIMIPFHMEGLNEHYDDIYGLLDNSLWSPAELITEKHVFFSHIEHFLQSSLEPGHQLQPHDYRFFTLNYEHSKTLQLIYKSTLCLRKRGRNLLFRFMKDRKKLNSTHLIIAPNASIGLFIIATELHRDNDDIADLINFNYEIHKTGCQQAPLYLQQQLQMEELYNLGKKQVEFPNDRRTQSLIKAVKAMKPSIEAWEEDMRKIGFNSEQKDTKSHPANTLYTWNIDYILKILFDSIKIPCRRFNELRCHLFTYLSVDTSNYDDALAADFLRIVRAENRKYEVIDTELSNTAQTFRNVYIGSSVEGSAIMTLSPHGNPLFFDEFFETSILQRYLWIYTMIVVQRYTQMHMLRLLTNVDDHNTQTSRVSLNRLRTFFQLLNEVKVNTYFTEVSEYTHHNQFYLFCSDKLGIQRTFVDIDQKMQTLNEHLVQLSNLRKEKYQRILSYLLALLAIASASNDALGWLKELFIVTDNPLFFVIAGYAIPLFCLIMIFFIWKKGK